MRQQLHVDNGARNDIVVQITEVQIITIGSNNGRNIGSGKGNGNGREAAATQLGGEIGTVNAVVASTTNAAAATATSEAVAQAIQTVNPNAPFNPNNQTILMPIGAPAPQHPN